MRFQNETGAIINANRDIVHFVPGTPGAVEFPEEVIWNLHKQRPGEIYALSHVHPPQMFELSGRDIITLRTWMRALYPFPVRIITIAERHSDYEIIDVVETCYLAMWEAKETWKARGGIRTWQIIDEWVRYRVWAKGDGYDGWYGAHLLNESYS